ncbi:UDP-N-acetylmuramate dehydrogenase [Synechococcus elongatus]|uniref:UDP-N-acetylmuramate dehydrogenase n=1 Tax=Synechococcus elongatus TaxID=32046 RepID=UPI0030CB8AF8
MEVVMSLEGLRTAVSLAPLTTFRVGGTAEFYLEPQSSEAIAAAWQWAQAESLPITFLGAGSNLLISDRGLDGLVINLRQLQGAHFKPAAGLIQVAAGEPIPRLAWAAARQGWRGLEWAVGIPGTIGGAAVMNAGAQGGCMADILQSVQVITPHGPETWVQADLQYDYRHSILQSGQACVVSVNLQLQPGFERSQVLADTSANFRQRKRTQPYHLPNCGSVFRNPEPQKAGQLIEACNLKGYQIGDAQVSELHANFILNCGSARAQDILDVIHHVQGTVRDRFGVSLHPEVKMLGEFQ